MHSEKNIQTMKAMTKLAFEYQKWIDEESKKTSQELKIRNVGKIDPQKHLEQNIDELMSDNIM